MIIGRKIEVLRAKERAFRVKEKKAITSNDSDGVVYFNDNAVLCNELIGDLQVLALFKEMLRISIAESHGFCFMTVNNGPVITITKEQYDQLKRYLEEE